MQVVSGIVYYVEVVKVVFYIALCYVIYWQASTNKIQENAGMMTEVEIEAVESRADVITYTVLAEMNHFQEHRVIDFRNYMQQYLQEQIAFYRQVISHVHTWECLTMLIISTCVGY